MYPTCTTIAVSPIFLARDDSKLRQKWFRWQYLQHIHNECTFRVSLFSILYNIIILVYTCIGIICRYYITKIMRTRRSRREPATFIRLTPRPSGLGIFNCPRRCSNRIRIKIQSGFDRNFLSLFHRSPRTRIVCMRIIHTRARARPYARTHLHS